MIADAAVLEDAARRFALMGEPTRLRILHILMERGELTVSAIANAAGISRFNASAHLNRLGGAGLVSRRCAGTRVFYRTEDENLPRICEWMRNSLQARARVLSGSAG